MEEQIWYYYLRQGEAVGPVSGDDLKSLIESRQLSLFDLVCLNDKESWRPLSEFDEFKSLLETVERLEIEDQWVLLVKKPAAEGLGFQQKGPYSTAWLRNALKRGEFSYRDFAWREGFEQWRRISELEEFNDQHEAKKFAPTNPIESIDQLPDIDITDVYQAVKRPSQKQPVEAEDPPPEADLGGLDNQLEPSFEPKPKTTFRQPEEPKTIRLASWQIVLAWLGRRQLNYRFLLRLGLLVGTVICLLTYLIMSSDPNSPGWVKKQFDTWVADSQPSPTKVKTKTSPSATKIKKGAGRKTVSAKQPKKGIKKAKSKTKSGQKLKAAKTKVAASPFRKPSYLKIQPVKLSSSRPRLIFKTNASPEFNVKVTIFGVAGEIIDKRAYYGNFKLKAKAKELPSLDLKKLKLTAGSYLVEAEIDALHTSRRIFIGKKNSNFKKSLAQQRKSISLFYSRERRRLFKAVSGLERILSSAKVESQSRAVRNWSRSHVRHWSNSGLKKKLLPDLWQQLGLLQNKLLDGKTRLNPQNSSLVKDQLGVLKAKVIARGLY